MNKVLLTLLAVLLSPAPLRAQIRLDGSPSQVKGTLPAGNGGTGQVSPTDDGILLGNGSVWQIKTLGSTCAIAYTHTTNTFSCLTVQDEGSNLTNRLILNFTGTGVECVDDTTKTTCDIGGAAAAAWEALVNTADTATSFTGSHDDETVTFDFQSAFAADRFTIKSSTGNPTAGALLGILSHDASIWGLHIRNNLDASLNGIKLGCGASADQNCDFSFRAFDDAELWRIRKSSGNAFQITDVAGGPIRLTLTQGGASSFRTGSTNTDHQFRDSNGTLRQALLGDADTICLGDDETTCLAHAADGVYGFNSGGTAPTVDAIGEWSFDTNRWDTDRGAWITFDGTAATAVVAILNSETCSDGKIPKYSSGTWTCADDADSGGATAWNAIGDAGADGSVSLGATEQDITADNDTADDEILELSNTDADRANTVTTFQISDADQDDANAVYQRMVSDIDGTPRVDYEFSQTGFTAVLPINPPAEAYDATGWNSDTGAPQKDAVRDQFEAEPSATRTLTNKTLNAADNVIHADTAVALAANGANCSAGQYPLGVDASGAVENCTAAGGGGAAVDIQLFEVADSGTNWTLPTDGQWIEVTACGSGGGGGGGSGAAVSNARTGGGGGGGGFCWKKTFQAADITSPVTVTVGAGGAGGAGGTAGSGTDGATGNTSSFGTYLIAYGGGGGAGHNAGAAGGGGGGCGAVGASATTTSGVAGGECVLASAANTTYADCRGAGSGNTQAAGNGGRASDCGGGSGSTSSSTGGGGTLAGGKSRLSSGGGGHGGGVNNANPGTAQDGLAGGDAGNMSATLNGGGGAAGASASACGAGGEGQPGNPAINTWRPGGQGGGGGASKNSTTGCDGGDGGYGGGGGGGGGGGTNVGGAGGDGGPGYVLIVTHF